MKLLSNLKPSSGNNKEDNKSQKKVVGGFVLDDDDDDKSSSGESSDDSSSSSSSDQEDDDLLASAGKGSSFEEESSSGANENNNGGVDAAVAHVHVVKMIRKESAAVDMWREIVTGMLVITAAMVTVTTYVLLTRQEVQEFSAGVSVAGQKKVMMIVLCLLLTCV
jgi:cobalamin biosynthesis Mg chelatase CobN